MAKGAQVVVLLVGFLLRGKLFSAVCVCGLDLSMWVGVARIIYMFGYCNVYVRRAERATGCARWEAAAKVMDALMQAWWGF